MTTSNMTTGQGGRAPRNYLLIAMLPLLIPLVVTMITAMFVPDFATLKHTLWPMWLGWSLGTVLSIIITAIMDRIRQ